MVGHGASAPNGTAEHAQQRRLARSGGSSNADHAGAAHLEVDAVEPDVERVHHPATDLAEAPVLAAHDPQPGGLARGLGYKNVDKGHDHQIRVAVGQGF